MSSEELPVALDAMGGDDAPEAIVAGAVLAAKDGLRVTLVGDEGRIRALLPKGVDVGVVHAADAVGMDEAATAVRRRDQSSIRVAMDLVRKGEACAAVSCGNSGAVLVAPGELWNGIDNALRKGSRGLAGGDSVSKLLARHGRKARHAQPAGARRKPWSEARRLAFKVSELARDANLTQGRGIATPSRQRDSALGKLTVEQTLIGQYRDIRQFIYELETAPEFLILENVALAAQGGEGSTALRLDVRVATYYRASDGD